MFDFDDFSSSGKGQSYVGFSDWAARRVERNRPLARQHIGADQMFLPEHDRSRVGSASGADRFASDRTFLHRFLSPLAAPRP
jgi:hypothetical protein